MPIDVVISGIGGRFPRSRNVKEFSDNLLTGEHLLEPALRWPPGAMDTPKLLGQTPDFTRFDYTFFGVHYDLAKSSDPMTRAACETAFEAVIDAGINPASLRGTNAQVYAATTHMEGDCFFDELGMNNLYGYVIMGRNRCMSANRVSYVLNLTGRSCAYDGSGAWIGVGLDLARRAIQSGECDTALVNGSSVIGLLEMSRTKLEFGLLSGDSRIRPYDFDVDGAARGDAQVTFVVQRADIAKRSYGSIVAVGTEAQGSLPNWLLSLNEDHLREFVGGLYLESGINPNDIKLIEADGLCVAEMVESELNVLDDVLNSKRPKEEPLYLGSVKTVTGDTEGSAGHTGLTKVILAMETGVISPTLGFGKPNPNIRALTDGRYKVVTEPTKWDITPDTLVAVSTLSYSGVVSHVVLKANGKAKPACYENTYPIPYLILMSGRNEEVIKKSLKDVTSSAFDPEYIRLTQEVFGLTIDKFEWRGYGFHGQDESEKFVIQRENRRPVWFVYSGMGSQWAGMGKNLILFPIVRATFERLNKVLETKGLDLINILTTLDESIFDNILHSFVGIAAVQIALTNLLFQLGIKFDGLIGHSVGELGCSYADGCLTEEQTILAAYERGMASLKAELIPGLMAAVGMGYNEAKDMLPSDVYVACRNSDSSCTISGPTESVTQVIESFKEKNIFVRGVNVSNIAYHSPYIKPAAPFLHEALCKVITDPKPRSSKWVCTSAPKEDWEKDEVRFCSAEYHTNNLLNPVLFEEGAASIPKNALVIEVAPHGLLQAILKRSLGNDAVNVPLTRKHAESSVKVLLEAIGKLFLEGLSPQIWHLYPDVSMPVSRGTPSLTPLLEWNHDEIFPIPVNPEPLLKEIVYDLTTAISPSIEIAGDLCLLTSYVLVMVWNRFSELNRWTSSFPPVVFENVRFNDVIRLEKDDVVDLGLMFLPGTGCFDITRNDVLVASGKIRAKVEDKTVTPHELPPLQDSVEMRLEPEDIYSEIENRSFGISKKWRTIKNLDIYPRDWVAEVAFDEDWTTLLNSLLTIIQLKASEKHQNPSFLCHIEQMSIDTNAMDDDEGTTARLYLPASTLTYRGVKITQAEFRATEKPVPKSLPASFEFVPYGETGLEDEEQFLCHVVQLCLCKRQRAIPVFKVCDFDGEFGALIPKLRNILQSDFSMQCELIDDSKDANLVLCGVNSIGNISSIFTNSDSLFLSRASSDVRKHFEQKEKCNLQIVAESKAGQATIPFVAITKKLPPLERRDVKILKMRPDEQLTKPIIFSSYSLIILVWENGTNQPIERLFADVRSNEGSERIRLVFLMTPNAPEFSLDLPFYVDQIRLNVPLNVYLDGTWGSYQIVLALARTQSGRENGLIQTDRSRNRHIDFVSLQSDIEKDKLATPKSQTVGYSEELSDGKRIMGVGRCEDFFSQRLSPDPLLQWSIPPSWDLESSASVPILYASVYMALFEYALLQPKETVFVASPFTKIGQAAIRVAVTLRCDIATMVDSPMDSVRLRRIFPWIHSNRIIVCKPTSDGFTMPLRRIFPEGIQVIFSDLSGRRLRAATTILSSGGRLIQVGEDAMFNADSIGMHIFLRVEGVYGISRETLLSAPVEVKKRIVSWVQKGLDTGVVVPPTGRMSILKALNNSIVTNGKVLENGAAEKIVKDSKSKPNSETRKSCVIVGGSKSQWVRLAYCLARKGYKLVASVQETPSPNLVARHSKILQREFGLELRELSPGKSGTSLLNNNVGLGPIKDIFIFDHNSFAEEVASMLESKVLKDTRVTFFSKASTQFSRMCERWDRDGLKVRAALGVHDAPTDAETSYLDWILSPNAPAVSVLSRSAFDFAKSQRQSLRETGLLPTSVAELQALGSSIRIASMFRELTTLCRSVRLSYEVSPLFFFKGIQGSQKNELESLATDLLAPLVEVTLPANCGSLEACTEDVIRNLQKIQKHGPYNLACDTLRIDLVLNIARILEDRGHASVVFLINEGIDTVRQVLTVIRQEKRFGEMVIKSALADSVDPHEWTQVNWDALPWAKQVQTALTKVACSDESVLEDVRAALDHIYQSLLHISEAKEVDLDHGIVHTLKKGEEYREYKVRDRVFDHTIPSSKLSRKEISDIISPNLATPAMQLEIERAKRRSLVCNGN